MKKNMKCYTIVTIFSTIFFYANATEEEKIIAKDTIIEKASSEATKPETRIVLAHETQPTTLTEEKRIVPANKTPSKRLIATLFPNKNLNVLDASEEHAFQRFLYWTKVLIKKYIQLKTTPNKATTNLQNPDQQQNMLLISQQSEAEKKIQALTDALKKTEQELQTTKEALEKSLDANHKQKIGHGAEKKKLLEQKNANEAELGKTTGSLESVRTELKAVTLRNNELAEEVAALRTTNQTLEKRNRELQSLGYDKSRLQGQVNILAESSKAAMTLLAKLQKSFTNNKNMKKLNENINTIDAAVTQLNSIIEEKQNSNDSIK